MTDRARDGPRRIVLWANDVIVGILTARNRKRRVRGFDGAEIHTMPTPRDVDGAISLFSAIFGFPSEVRTLRRLARTVPWTAVVLVLGERVEGYCFFRIYPGKRALLLSMAVDPERTGRGYGRAILSFALDVLENAGIRTVELEVEPEIDDQHGGGLAEHRDPAQPHQCVEAYIAPRPAGVLVQLDRHWRTLPLCTLVPPI